MPGGAYNNSASVRQLYEAIAGRNYRELQLLELPYAQLDHGAMDNAAFHDSLRILLGD